ncbi:hypothetical protein ES703_58157 [subsurface metagenome]
MIQATKTIQASAVTEQSPWRLRPIHEEEWDILRPRQRPPFIEWMESNYILEGGTSAIEGPWSREYTPYFVEIAEWLSDTVTREVWIYACAQSGKTTLGTGFVGYVVDCAPGPTLLIMPSKDDVKNRVEARIRPMFAANDDLMRHVAGRVRNIYIGKQTVMDHMIIYIGWPTTPQALADKPVCYIIADETGKYPPFVGEEADPVSLMRKRQRWFKGRSKLLGMTTPVTADDMSDQEWVRGDCCEWWVPCPKCGKWHQLVWENVKIDRTAKKEFYDEQVYRSGKHSRYVCPKCEQPWTEDLRWQAVCAGKFIPGDCELDLNGRLIGEIKSTSFRSCRVHALMLHPMVETIVSLTAEFVRAQKAKQMGNIQPLKDFWNSQLARPWREARSETAIDTLQTHIGSCPKGKVPAGVQMLTAGLDVQLDHVYMRVLGWGYLAEYWSIFEERIETGPTDRVENLEKLIPYLTMRFELFEDEKLRMRIALSAIDRMYNTETVDAFCVRCAGAVQIIPVAGDDYLQKQMWRVGKAAGGRLKRYDLNVTAYKDALYRGYFEASKEGAGYGHLHAETPYEVLEHLTSEHKIIQRKGPRIRWIGWVVKKEGRPNHYWDDDVYARAAAEIAGLWTLADPGKKTEQTKPIGKPVKKRPIRTRY